MHCNTAHGHTCCLLSLPPQLLQQRPGLLKIGGLKALSEPAVDRRQGRMYFGTLALLLPEAGQTGGRAQLQGFGLLAAGDVQGLAQTGLGLRLVRDGLAQLEAFRSANSTVACLRSPSRLRRACRTFSVRCGGLRQRRPLLVYGQGRSWRRGRTGFAGPDQATAVVLDDLWMGVEQLILERLQVVVVQTELQLEGTIGHAASALEHRHCLIEHLLEGHGRASTTLATTPGESKVCHGWVSMDRAPRV
jgi:hypothetical protein